MHVAVIGPDAQLPRALQEAARQHGCSVSHAESVVLLVATHPWRPDALILDCDAVDDRARDEVRTARELLPDAAIVMLLAAAGSDGETEAIAGARALGAALVETRPVAPLDLVTAIERLLTGGGPATASAARAAAPVATGPSSRLVRLDGVWLDLERAIAFAGDRQLRVTQREFEVLEGLALRLARSGKRAQFSE